MKIVIPSILAVTVLVAGIFAIVPIDQAATVHNAPSLSSVNVLQVDKTLVQAGVAETQYTFTATTQVVITSVFIDSTDTVGNQGDYVFCRIEIDGVTFKNLDNNNGDGDGVFCDADANPDGQTFGNNDNLEMRDLFGAYNDDFGSDIFNIPLDAGQVLVMGFNTNNGVNDIELEMTVGFTGVGTLQ